MMKASSLALSLALSLAVVATAASAATTTSTAGISGNYQIRTRRTHMIEEDLYSYSMSRSRKKRYSDALYQQQQQVEAATDGETNKEEGSSYDATEVDVFQDSGCRSECLTNGDKLSEGEALCVRNLQLGLKDGKLTLSGPNDLDEYDGNDDDVILWQSDNEHPGDLVTIHRGSLMIIDTVYDQGVVWQNSVDGGCETNTAVVSLLSDKGFTLFDEYEYPLWRLYDYNDDDHHKHGSKEDEDRDVKEEWMSESLDCTEKDGGVEDDKKKHHAIDGGDDPTDESIVEANDTSGMNKQQRQKYKRQKAKEEQEEAY